MYLTQSAYTHRILQTCQTRLADARDVAIPMEPTLVLVPNDREATKEDRQFYQSLVGSLMYLMLCTRPDIAYPVSQLRRCTNDVMLYGQ